MPEVFGQHEISQTAQIVFKYSGKHFCGILQNALSQKNPKFPQAAQNFVLIWKIPSRGTVQSTVKLIPSYHFTHILVILTPKPREDLIE